MHISAQHAAALTVVLLSTHTVASGVKAALIDQKGGLERAADLRSSGLGNTAGTYSTIHDVNVGNTKRGPIPDPEPEAKGGKSKTKAKKPSPGQKHNPGRKPASLGQEPSLRENLGGNTTSVGSIVDGVSQTSGIVSELGNIHGLVQDTTAVNKKRETEPI